MGKNAVPMKEGGIYKCVKCEAEIEYDDGVNCSGCKSPVCFECVATCAHDMSGSKYYCHVCCTQAHCGEHTVFVGKRVKRVKRCTGCERPLCPLCKDEPCKGCHPELELEEGEILETDEQEPDDEAKRIRLD